ncbi:MAG TPA: winged helix-turn-helix domain-containing protein [Sphingomonas sp.]
MHGSNASRRRRRLWRFAGAEFDEASWTLRIDGQPVPLEGKPLEVLHELLLRAGEVVTKDEILDAVWPGVAVVEGSLPTAISKLRKALGERQDNIIETVPRVGYRLISSVRIESVESPLAPRFTFAVGDMVPGRKQWQLVRPLGATGAADVWLARQTKTGEQRVFKFADAPDRLRALKREAALSRVVFAGLGATAPLPALLEWNFESSPYFLEYAYGGTDLIAWAEGAGGLAAISLDRRLSVAARICRAVADVHGLGVLHKDLKPANVLIADGDGAPVVRLADFGSGRLLDDSILDSFQITDPGSLAAELDDGEPRSGTLAYRAPELTGAVVPTVKSDIYALGLILYQLAVGDFTAALGPGWEDNIPDPVLRGDIRAAAEVAPERRIASADELAERIERIEERRQAAARDAGQAAWLAEQERQAERRRVRRPWVRAAIVAALIGLVGTSAMAWLASRQRDQARQAQAQAEASYDFLADDILASPDPSNANGADERLVDAVRRASGDIDRRFANQPLVAARLYATLARAFDQRSEYAAARGYYDRAWQWFTRAGAASGVEANIMRLQRASAEAFSTHPGSLDRARALVAAARRDLGERGKSGEPAVWLEQAEGTIAMVAEDVPAARDHYARAAALADKMPERFDERQRLNMHQRHAFALARLGETANAARELTPLVAAMSRLEGPDSPDTLLLRLNLAQTKANSGDYEAALADINSLLPHLEARLGPEHRHTLQALSVRQLALGSLGRYREAAADAERVWRAAAAKDGVTSFAAVAMRSDLGTTQCRAGDYAKGEANTRAAYQAARAAAPQETALAQAIRVAVADCLIPQHKIDQAAPLLRNVDRVRVNQLVGDAHWDAGLDLSLAEVAFANGDRQEALARIRAVDAVYPEPPADLYLADRLARLRKALGI